MNDFLWYLGLVAAVWLFIGLLMRLTDRDLKRLPLRTLWLFPLFGVFVIAFFGGAFLLVCVFGFGLMALFPDVDPMVWVLCSIPLIALWAVRDEVKEWLTRIGAIKPDSRAVVQRWFQEVWSEGRDSTIDELFAPAAVMTGVSAEPLIGPDCFRGFHRAMNEVFTDFRITINEMAGKGNTVFLRFNLAMTHKATNRQVSQECAGVARCSGGQLLEARTYIDFLSVLEQIGATPAGAFERAIAPGLANSRGQMVGPA